MKSHYPPHEKLAWTDSETFGLDSAHDPIIELGIIITNLDLEVIAADSWLAWSPVHDRAYAKLMNRADCDDEDAQYVLDMHRKNNLFFEAKSINMEMHGRPMDMVEQDAIHFLETHDATGLPMAGNNVRFDRQFIGEQMPQLDAKYHYRIVDVSTVKELCRRYNPRVFEYAPKKNEQHRVIPDLQESINEFRFYLENFLFDGRGDVIYPEG